MEGSSISGHGGYRSGAGRKSVDAPEASAIVRFNEARARHEETKADNAALDLQIKRGQYLPRESIRVASATAVAAVVQSLRSLSDNLEREFNLSPKVAEAIERRVDEALADLGKQFRAMANE